LSASEKDEIEDQMGRELLKTYRHKLGGDKLKIDLWGSKFIKNVQKWVMKKTDGS
jgi:hypothetical protein